MVKPLAIVTQKGRCLNETLYKDGPSVVKKDFRVALLSNVAFAELAIQEAGLSLVVNLVPHVTSAAAGYPPAQSAWDQVESFSLPWD